jgi:hypothetical protein
VMSNVYIAKFRQGSGPMCMNAIDYYWKDGGIIRHSWAMGGSTKTQVYTVPEEIDGYRKINIEDEE